MKKIVIVLSVVGFAVGMTSCKTHHEKCAAYSKVDKVNTDKTVANKTVKPA